LEAGREPAKGLKANEVVAEEQGQAAKRAAEPDREIVKFKTAKRCSTEHQGNHMWLP
jgi:hypothetical protein